MATPRPEELTLGLLLVALGVVATLANLGKLDLLETLRAYWPIAFVVWGGLEVVESLRTRGAR